MPKSVWRVSDICTFNSYSNPKKRILESEVAQSCPTLCDPIPRPWDFPGKDTAVGCHFLLQGIFLTQGLNLGLPHCRQTSIWATFSILLEGWGDGSPERQSDLPHTTQLLLSAVDFDTGHAPSQYSLGLVEKEEEHGDLSLWMPFSVACVLRGVSVSLLNLSGELGRWRIGEF